MEAPKHDHCCKHGGDHADEELSKLIKQIPLGERKKIIALNHHLSKKRAQDEELEEQIATLQKEYDMKALPYYEQMRQLYSGERAPTNEELAEVGKYFTPEEEAQKQENLGNSEAIPKFWHTILKNCQSLSHIFSENEKDLEVLESLLQLTVEYVADKEDFTLKFVFADNAFFTNKELTKSFLFQAPKSKNEPAFPSQTVGTKIDWKDGQNITKKTVQKKQKNKKTGATRSVKKEVDQDSFFNFFKSQEPNDNLDQEEKEKQEYKLEDDFEIGRTLADDVIPFSLEYYLGINPEESDFEDVDEEDDEKDDDNDDDEKDDDSEDDKKKNKKKNKGKEKSKPDTDAPKAEAKPECKQQ